MTSEILPMKTIINKLDYRSLKRLKKKDLLLLANKLIEKVPDPRNAKQYFESVLRKKKRKSVKQSEILLINQKLLKTQTLLI